MQRYINGGIYRVDFSGHSVGEFDQTHPALIVRTLKENEMYIVVPLTSYTAERWAAYRKRYCVHLLSSNSIARIDKFIVIHNREIKNRWKESQIVKITYDEFSNVNQKLDQYLQLSCTKALTEYDKYLEQYNDILSQLQLVVAGGTSPIFNFSSDSTHIYLQSNQSNFYWLFKDDLLELASIAYAKPLSSITYTSIGKQIHLKIKK